MRRPFIVDTYQKDILCLIDKYAENEKLLYHFNIDDICSYSPSVEKMDNMMRCHGFVMLLRCSEKFQSYLEKILPWCKPEETCLIYSQYHGYIDKREGNTAFNQKLYDFVEQFRERGCFVKEDLHTSGHASKQDLARLCEQVNPKVIIPIHKDEKADLASILSDELRARVCEYEYSMDGVDISLDSL